MSNLRVVSIKSAYVPAFDRHRVKPLTLEDVRAAVFERRKAGFTEAANIDESGIVSEDMRPGEEA